MDRPVISSIKLTKRGDRTFLASLLYSFITPFGYYLSKPGKSLPIGSPRLNPHSSLLPRFHIKEHQVDGIWIYDLTLKIRKAKRSPSSSVDSLDSAVPTKRIYYFAGGSFCMPPSSEHWKFCGEICAQLPEAKISIISPPLAPFTPAPDAFPQLLRLYRSLMKEAERTGESVTFAGDSSGGNLALALTLGVLEGEILAKLPDSVLVISPIVDLGLGNPEIKVAAKSDPLLRLPTEIWAAGSWAGLWGITDTRLSPLLADLSLLQSNDVKVHGVIGGYDLLAPDAKLFRHRCEVAGVQGEWLEWDKQIHCFPLIYGWGIKESIEAKDWIVDVLRRNT